MAIIALANIVQALLFGLVLTRDKGITLALVTLVMVSVFHVLVLSNELGKYTGSDVGLQGIIVPDYLSPASQRLRLYFIAL